MTKAVRGTETKSLIASRVSISRSGRQRSRSSISTTNTEMPVFASIFSNSSRNLRTPIRSGFSGSASMREDQLILPEASPSPLSFVPSALLATALAMPAAAMGTAATPPVAAATATGIPTCLTASLPNSIHFSRLSSFTTESFVLAPNFLCSPNWIRIELSRADFASS